jgi:hypothetical protein
VSSFSFFVFESQRSRDIDGKCCECDDDLVELFFERFVFVVGYGRGDGWAM